MSALTAGIAGRQVQGTVKLHADLPSPPESSQTVGRHGTQQIAAVPHIESPRPLDTPNPSPPSCVPSSEAASGRRRKQVDFSPFATAGDDGESLSALKALPPSRECRSSKSILKPGVPSSPNQEEEQAPVESLQSLMERLTPKALASDLSSRMRIYTSLFVAFKAYRENAGSQAVNERLPTLMDSIERELSAVDEPHPEPALLNLRTQTLKLLAIIIWNPSLSIYLTNAHRSWILDHAIQSLQRPELPKVITMSYLHVLSIQTFSQTLMTTARAVRLLHALKDISTRVPGNGVVSERLLVYRRVLDQAKTAFKKCSSHWPQHLLEAMTSKNVDTRTKALELGYSLVTHLGSSLTVSKAIRDVLDVEGDGQEKFGSNICKRLCHLLKTTDEPHQIPQIWSVVMLLLRELEPCFHEWHGLPEWICLIQKCFNGSNSEVRVRANKAWDKLVYVARPHRDTESFLAKMLIKPILAQLERSCTPGHFTTTRASAFSSYCNLLYIALKPSTTSVHYDAVWAMYIKPVFLGPFSSNEDNSERACRILSSLFWKSTPMPWRPGRALEAMTVEIEELPLLDFRWIRSQVPSILEIFERLFRTSKWVAKGPYSQAHVATAWENFAKALGEACRKEVIPSPETLSASRHIIRFLTQKPFWRINQVPESRNESLPIWSFLCGAIFSELGPTMLGAAARAPKTVTPFDVEGEGLSNEAELVAKLLQALEAVQGDHDEAKIIETIVKLLRFTLDARSSLKHQIRHCRAFCDWLLKADPVARFARNVWQATAKVASEAITSAMDAPLINQNEMLHFCADLREILRSGARFGEEAYEVLLLLKTYLLISVHHDPYQAVIKPLTEVLGATEQPLETTWTAFVWKDLLSYTLPGEDKEKRLERSLPVFRNIIAQIDSILASSYFEKNTSCEDFFSDVEGTILTILRGPSADLSCACLVELERSLYHCFHGHERACVTKESIGSVKRAQAQRLWPAVIETLGRLAGRIDLGGLDSIVATGLLSTHETVRNDLVKMWETSYSSQGIGYGPRSRRALGIPSPSELEARAKLELPAGEDVGFTGAVPAIGKKMVKVAPKAKSSAKKAREKPKPRFSRKHDDSQIDFVAIESSPRIENLESQDLTTRQKEVRDKQARGAPFGLGCTRSPPRQPSLTNNLEPLDDSRSTEPQLESLGDLPVPIPQLEPLDDSHSSSPQVETATPISIRQKSYEDAIRTTPTPKSKEKQHSQDLEVQHTPTLPVIATKQAADKEIATEVDEQMERSADELQILHSDDNDFWSASQLSEDLRQVVGPSPTLSCTKGSPPTLSVPAKRRLSSSSEQVKKRTRAAANFESPQGSEILSSPPTKTAPFRSDRDAKTAKPEREKVHVNFRSGPLKSLDTPDQARTEKLSSPLGGPRASESAMPAQMEDITSSPPSLGGLPDSNQYSDNHKEKAVSFLERALAVLRNSDAVMDRSSLRMVEDLVFEIRTEAQNATQRS